MTEHTAKHKHKPKHIKKVKIKKYKDLPKHEVKRKSSGPDPWMLATLALLVLIIVGAGYFLLPTLKSKINLGSLVPTTGSGSSSSGRTQTSGSTEFGSVKLDFYVMSQCPYGTQVENAVAPALDLLGDSVDFNLNFIANDNGDGTFKSLHGEQEVQGNLVQLCAMEYNPDEYMDMIVCMNKQANLIPGNWEKCAKDNGLDVDSIKECYEGEEGKELLRDSIYRTQKVGASGSPTMYINDQPYGGGRDTGSFLRALCAQLDDHPECAELPACSTDADCTKEADMNGRCLNPSTKEAECEYSEPVKVKVTVLNDKRCATCDPSGINSVTKNLFKGAEFEEIDVGSDKGAQLYEDYDIVYLPAYILDENVEDTLTWETNPNIRQSFKKNDDGSYQILASAVGSVWDPHAEICDNEKDDNDDGLTDCEDEKCQGTLACMPKLEKAKLDIFVMSQCPYGAQFEKGAIPVIEALGDDLDWDIHFVYYSMHGEVEIKEQLLQYCMQEDYNDEYLPYLKCFLEEGDTASCLDEVGLSESDLKDCMDMVDSEYGIWDGYNDKSTWLNGRYPLFGTSADLNEKYSVGGSPTWVVNGVKIENVARDPASILQAVCKGYEDKPDACDDSLSTSAYGPGFGYDGAVPSAASAGGACG